MEQKATQAAKKKKPAKPSEVAAHHRGEMRDRRSVELRVFTGMVVVLLLIAKESPSLIQAVTSPLVFKWTVTGCVSMLVMIYGIALVVIERRNAYDRPRYRRAEREMLGEDASDYRDCFFEILIISWGATYPFLATLVVAGAVVVFVWNLIAS